MQFRRLFVAASLLALLTGLAGPARTQTVAAAAMVSSAESTRAYRMDAARHIYTVYADKIFKGKLPPLVHAIVVLEVELDAGGHVRQVHMVRVPTHAPDVTARVKDMIHRASPMPAPSRLGGARFTEIWLVDRSGQFQLDALTEGQL
jgi:hypothetical protein